MHSIKLSDDTYRRLQKRAIPFRDKEEEDVIRRLLDQTDAEGVALGGPTNGATQGTPREPSDLVSHVGSVPHGSRLRATYKGKAYHAEVNDGRIVWGGQRYRSLSEAAVAVIQSTGSKRPTENGWRFWEVQTPNSSKWRSALNLKTK